jgi:NTP pyrophosphatase (non-canonical NTP hydrolase)
MELKEIVERAKEVKDKYRKLEIEKYGKTWTNDQIAQGFVGDVGDLMKIIMAKEGIREMEDMDDRLEYELVDCLFSIAVLASIYGIDLEKAFLRTMDNLETRISKGYG